ncbi:hypothetical protein C1H46_039741 [Malus baccata]|uniref:Protein DETOXIFICATION n=1 Tax=Malus baccata TaxID=106549 RepID=A0A540KKM1_MALBA|nr:hypothetical protein C1H46_039741 [Malus baccata]
MPAPQNSDISPNVPFSKRWLVIQEAKLQLWLAGPLIAVSLLQYSLQVTAVMFVGHLGELELSSASMASSFANVTGFSVLLGMGSALETLCGQAYGAKQYHMLGVHMQKAMLILLAVSIPLSLIWFYTSDILMALHQDHEISAEAGTFNRWMIPSLFAFSLLQCLNRFLQTQNNVFPMMITSGVTAFLHIAVCWGLIFKSGLRNKGAALAISISHWLNVVLVASYVLFSPACKKTWTGFSKQASHDIFSFVKLAISSAVMLCLEYWCFEMVVLLSGLLPNPKLETSVLSISLNTCWMVYTISVGLGSAIRGCGWQNLCVAINFIAYYAVGIPTAVVFAFVLHIGGMGLWMGIICGLVVQLTALVVVNLRTDWNKEVSSGHVLRFTLLIAFCPCLIQFLISGNEGCQSCSEYHLSHRRYDLGNLMRQIKAIFSSVFDRNVLS